MEVLTSFLDNSWKILGITFSMYLASLVVTLLLCCLIATLTKDGRGNVFENFFLVCLNVLFGILTRVLGISVIVFFVGAIISLFV